MGIRRRRRLGEAGWRALLARFAGSGQSVVAFCRGEGVSAASFHRWRRQLEDSVSLGPVPLSSADRGLVGGERSPPKTSAGFVDLGALLGGTRSGRLELRIELGDGMVLHLARG